MVGMHKYPKLLLLAATFVLAIVLYRAGVFRAFERTLDGGSYLSVFVAGFFFSYSFTTAFAIAFFIAVAPDVHPFAAAPLAGAGALCADFLLFRFIRSGLDDEIHRLKSTRLILWLGEVFHRHSPLERIRTYLLWSVAGLIIASPLPDELGVSLLSTVGEIDPRKFAVFCFAVNTLGVLAILLAARAAG